MNRVIVKINGQEYTMVGMEPKEYLLKVANYVDEKLENIMRENPKLSVAMAAVLTSLNIADEQFKCKSELDNQNTKYTKPLQELKDVTEVVENLKMSVKQKEEELKLLRTQAKQLVEQNKILCEQNTTMSEQLVEKDKKIDEAQQLVSDFQNRQYDMQMKLVELEKDS